MGRMKESKEKWQAELLTPSYTLPCSTQDTAWPPCNVGPNATIRLKMPVWR